MIQKQFQVTNRIPSALEYLYLRETVGWSPIPLDVVEVGLKNSLFSLCVSQDDKLIGFGRVVGDGAIYFYIQDIIVIPQAQKQGVGKLIMNHIMGWIHKNTTDQSFIGLMAASGAAPFYYHFGFRERGPNSPGMRYLRSTSSF